MKRNCGMLIRFTKAEMAALTEKAGKTNYSRESFCRAVLNGIEVKQAPSADTVQILRELKRAGYALEQLSKKEGPIGSTDAFQTRKVLDDVDAAAKAVILAFGGE